MTEAVLHSDDIVGWHGEIHDSQVVEDDETARRRETEDDRGEEQTQETEAEEAEHDEEEEADEHDEEEEADEQDDDQRATEEEQQQSPRRRTAARKSPVTRRSRESEGANR
ncbi:hypothetical protein [Nocardia sp. NPDC059228]|uniref:hypothetical protein n=1 Tax=Nocardia sp. NPDC059228 TaxID=3346777 RepID=UPI0036BBEE60